MTWTPLRQANLVRRITENDVRVAMARTGQDEATARAALEAELNNIDYWINDLYQVARRPIYDQGGNCGAVHLNIRRRDGKPIFRDWRHFQRIKNELVGEECEGIEIYPAESRLTDESNKYHLWVFTDPTYRVPFGFTERNVIDADKEPVKPGYRQRRLDHG